MSKSTVGLTKVLNVMSRVLVLFLLASTVMQACASSWYIELLRSGQLALVKCRRKTRAFESTTEDYHVSLVRMKNCVSDLFLGSLDNLILEKEVPINPYVTMIMENNINNTFLPEDNENYSEDVTAQVSKRVFRLFETHTFKVNLQPSVAVKDGQVEGRRRHHYRRAFPMMVAGFMMMSAFLVPLGFQFMAMIGGKALLLAKMAFFMSMFSGYKRLTNDLDYHHHHGGNQELLHHLAFHHRSSESPMTAAYAHQAHGLVPLYRKG